VASGRGASRVEARSDDSEVPGEAPLETPAALRKPVDLPSPDVRLLGLAGVEQVRASVRGAIAPPAVSRLLGLRPVQADVGTVTFEMRCSDWLVSSNGDVQPGTLAPLVDAAMAAVIQTTLPAGMGQATISLALEFLAPVRVGDLLTCQARSVGAASDGLARRAEATVTAGDGQAVACATARSLPYTVADPPPSPPEKLPERATPNGPAPWEEKAVGEPVAVAARDGSTGLELLDQLARGALAPPPIYHLTGIRPTSADRGTAAFAIPANRWLCSLAMNLQGGVLALLAEAALGGAVTTTLEAGERQRPLEVHVAYLRPVPAEDPPVRANASVVHRGQNVVFASAELLGTGGKQVAAATSVNTCTRE
jgi:uncharacterized protein (TIGR00369 family)